MSASFSAIWSPAALARMGVVPAAETVVAAVVAPVETPVETPTETAADVSAPQADGEWSREVFDAGRDDDPFAWLGFEPEGA